MSDHSPIGDWAAVADALFGASEVALLVTDAQVDEPGPRILHASPAFTRMTGYAAEEVIGRSPRLLQSAETGQAELDRLRSALEQQQPARVVLHSRRADGRPFVVELDVSPVRDQAGTVINFVAVQRDVTQREQEHRQLVGTAQHLRLALDAGKLGTWEYYFADERFVHDALCAELFGGAPDGPAMSIEDCLAAVHVDDLPTLRRMVDESLTSGHSYEHIFRVHRRDGSVRWTMERARAVCDAQGRPERLDGIVMDVTDREDAALRVVEALDSVTDGYHAFDHDWRFTHVNRSAELVLGRPRDELVGQVLWEAFPELEDTDFASRYRQVAETREPLVFEAFYEPWQRWYEERVFPTEDGIAAFFLDVTDRVAYQAQQQRVIAAERAARQSAETAQRQLAYAAAHDELTGLLSRQEFERQLDERLRTGLSSVVLFLDLDNFKLVNDGLGHAVGDEVLADIGCRLRDQVAPETAACRFGGDEFLLVTDGGVASALQLSRRLRDLLSTPYQVRARTVSVTTSVGLAVAAEGDDAATLIRNADAALFAAKRSGNGQAVVYDEPLHQQAVERLDLEDGLRAARSRDELALHYQPIYDIATGRRCGLEALLRWHHPQRGLLPAGSFIDIAEDSGLILPIGDWVLGAAARSIAAGPPAGSDCGPVWINVAPQQLSTDAFVDRLAATQEAYGLDPGQLGVELTERTLVHDPQTVNAQLDRLHRLGVPLAIDDFGTGYSSMSALQHYPIDVIKIDRTFVAQLDRANGRSVVGAIIQLAHALGASASAEGVEQPAQWAALTELGCDTAAGYLLGCPQPLDATMPDAVDRAHL